MELLEHLVIGDVDSGLHIGLSSANVYGDTEFIPLTFRLLRYGERRKDQHVAACLNRHAESPFQLHRRLA